MTITASDIPIPSTAADYTPPVRPSLEETRKHRAREARHQTSACPHCGEWAIVETVTVNRPGLPGVVQTVSRCQRQPRWRGERCPLTILSEEWAEDTTAPEAEKEEIMPEKTCATCGADISHRGRNARFCEACSAARQCEHMMAYRRRVRSKSSSRAEQVSGSVMGLVQRAAKVPEILDAIRDALALSPERQDLLRRLLDDVEAA